MVWAIMSTLNTHSGAAAVLRLPGSAVGRVIMGIGCRKESGGENIDMGIQVDRALKRCREKELGREGDGLDIGLIIRRVPINLQHNTYWFWY